MLEAVVFLKRTQTDGNVVETSKGIWMRSHAHPSDHNHELKTVSQLPRFSNKEAPTVAIVTTTYVEKMAVDAMFESKTSYFIENQKDKLNNSIYTVGKILNKTVVAVKVEHFNPEKGSTERQAQSITSMLSQFSNIKTVFLVGVGGAVPDYNNFERHCRRGDVVFSSPRSSDEAMYVLCPEVDDEPDLDPTGTSAFFPTSCWNSDDVSSLLQKHVRALVEHSTSLRSSNQEKPWEKFINDGLEKLGKADERFHRPSQKTDKLFVQFDRRQDPMEVIHPSVPRDKTHMRKDNLPVLKCGAIGSGSCVARDHIYRRLFAKNNQITAYDCGLDKMVEVLMEKIGGGNTAIILGVSDYSDGTAGKSWQPYAALAAAACAKSLVALL